MSFPGWKLISALSMGSLSVCYGYYLVLLSRGGGGHTFLSAGRLPWSEYYADSPAYLPSFTGLPPSLDLVLPAREWLCHVCDGSSK